MLKQYSGHFSGIFRFFEVLVLLFSFYAVYSLRYGSIHLNPLALPAQYQVFLATQLVLWVYVANRFQIYASKRMTTFTREAMDIGKSATVSITIATILSFFFREDPISRLFLVGLWQVQIGSLVLLRFLARRSLKYIRRRGYNYRQILIVGRNDRAARMLRTIEETPDFGLRILGFIDSPNGKHDLPSFDRYKLLGGLDNLESVLREYVVDEVFVLLPMKSFYSDIERILTICETVGVEVRIPADLFSLRLARMHVSLYGDVPLMDFYTSPRMSWQLFMKRLIDIAISALLILMHAPLFALVAVLVKVTSKGPVFFKQPRVGYNGRMFKCLKFRTMVENAEELKKELTQLNEMDGPVFKIRTDPRLTKIGRVLRKMSFDEMPQLVNVLRGEMSLVGPRPPVPEEVNQYQLRDLRRMSMRPGLTCLWQVSGRSDISFREWMELDRRYIDQWSLWLDVKILARTIPAVLRGSGAA